ncbi:MAG: PIN domain-containing protein [Treponema sp.]|jgi:PIN domain nuclease of toxin-antitoxin system|nr:PIN domain-containing protein [Treponema sp.]
MNYALDACALIAFLNDEEGADSIEELLDKSLAGDVSLSMSIINLFEVYYGELRDKGAEIAQVVLDMARHYSINIINTISEGVFHEAARLKARYKVSVGDSIGLATAAELGGLFVSSDHHDLDIIDRSEPGRLYWFR